MSEYNGYVDEAMWNPNGANGLKLLGKMFRGGAKAAGFMANQRSKPSTPQPQPPSVVINAPFTGNLASGSTVGNMSFQSVSLQRELHNLAALLHQAGLNNSPEIRQAVQVVNEATVTTIDRNRLRHALLTISRSAALAGTGAGIVEAARHALTQILQHLS